MTIYTSYGTYTNRIARLSTIEDAWNIDPHNDLELPDDLREQMDDEAREHFLTEANRILAHYELDIDAAGQIIGPRGLGIEDEAWEEIQEEIGMIDFDPIIDKYMSVPTLYTKPGCGPCLATERQFKQHGIVYKKIDVTQDPEALAYVTETLGYQSVPVVETASGEHWSGHKHDKIADLAPNTSKATVIAAPSQPDGGITVIAQSRHIDISNQTPDM